jgi:hypothetical protein
MAFLDWIKTKPGGQPPAAEEARKTQTAREMYVARDAQEQANKKPISPEVKEQADRVTAGFANNAFNAQPAISRPAERNGGDKAAQRNALDQGNIPPALGPTTEQANRVAHSPQPPLHNRPTPDEIIADERSHVTGKSCRPEPSQVSRPERGGWER